MRINSSLRSVASWSMPLAVLFAASSFVAMSQEKGGIAPQKPAINAPQPATDVKVWDIKSELAVHNDNTRTGEASGVVAINREDRTTVRCDLFKWNDKLKEATGSGNLQLTDEQADATGEKLDIYYGKSKRLAVLTGSVAITLKPKQVEKTKGPAPVELKDGKAKVVQEPAGEDEESPRRYPVLVQCDKLEYRYAKDKKYGKLTGNFKATQKVKDVTRFVTAQYAEWFGADERVVLYPPVHMEDTKGRKMDTDEKVYLSLREDAEKVQTKKGTFVLPVEDDDDEKPAKPVKPAKP